MRTCFAILATTVLAGAVGSSWAQQPAAPPPPGAAPAPGVAPAPSPYPAEMAIVVPEVEVRSGPTREYYPTSKLTYGQRVVVLRESKDQPGWVAIKPPQGSFSWVNAKNVTAVDPRTGYVIEGGEVQVLPGSTLVNREPNVESSRIKPGHLVVLLDRPMTVGQMTWYPIQTVPTEVRWIPVDAIRPVQTTSAWNQAQPWGTQPFANTSQVQTLLQQADQALQAGNTELARQLYKEASEKTQDFNQRQYAQQRLQQMPASTWNPGNQPLANAPYQPIPNNQSQPGVRPLAPSSPTSGTWTQPGAQSPPGAQPGLGTPPAATSASPPQWSGWGTLKRTAMDRDGQPLYVLENRQGQAMMYATSGQGSSLREYVNRMVCLYGPVNTRTDSASRVPHIVATHIAQQ